MNPPLSSYSTDMILLIFGILLWDDLNQFSRRAIIGQLFLKYYMYFQIPEEIKPKINIQI